MKLPIYKVDAFAGEVFSGNPAAVIPLESWLPDETMQNIAMENNLSETAFFVEEPDRLRIRWFTPAEEVALCGHATLATAHVLFNHLNFTKKVIEFNSRSGILKVEKEGNELFLDFPASNLQRVDFPEKLIKAFNKTPKECVRGKDDLMLIFDNEKTIRSLKPDFSEILKSDYRGIIVTAKGGKADFVSRFFAPRVGVNENPVTGSAHTMLIPYWSEELKKKKMIACQVSTRSGFLICIDNGRRVKIGGEAVTYLIGEIFI